MQITKLNFKLKDGHHFQLAWCAYCNILCFLVGNNMVHVILLLLHPHLWVLQGMSLWQEHRISLRICSETSKVPSETVVGTTLFESSCCNGGGSDSKACLQIDPWRLAQATFFPKASFVGGKDASLGAPANASSNFCTRSKHFAGLQSHLDNP